MMDIAFRLKNARLKAGFSTAAAAARRLGVAYPTYAAHENGSRGIGNEELLAYAKAFKVEASWLLGERQTGTLASDRPGFAEPDLVPFRGKAVEALAALSSPLSRHRMLYRCTRDHIGFAILKDDLIVMGTANGATTDGLVVVNLVDLTIGSAVTVLRHLKQDVLFPPVGQGLPDEDALTPTIYGHVLAVIRTPQLVS